MPAKKSNKGAKEHDAKEHDDVPALETGENNETSVTLPPQKVIRWGVIGTNFITDRFADAGSKLPNFKITAVYSRTEERAKEYAKKVGAEHTFSDLASMASSDVCDAVYVASPTSCHAKQCIILLKAKKHVLCEKPVCSNTKELEQVLAAAKESGATFMEAMRQLFTPNFQLVGCPGGLLDAIKPVRLFSAHFSQQSSRYPAFCKGENPNAFLPEFSNGALMDLGCYAISTVIALLGVPSQAYYVPVMLRTGVDGSGTLVMTYPDKVANVTISKQVHGFSHSEVQGENGTVSINHLADFSEIAIQAKGMERKEATLKQEENNLQYEIAEFMNLIETEKQEHPTCSWSLTRAVMAVLESARKSAGIVFPADKE
mmetsp:Transcript_178/g.380  ORF Transcript_178/g.380 Transcript_178/m.380 type:complete len:372 (+) Transcript_178:33-1148(+)|eukprot:CAMPEP_0175150612 /NCGR_PEP_ID=MMETSP0087-20121206/17990_1 /TAXON_ID=136419 /ORGANISM="Unknown Unknown, Strain D1" /LENGTH=371 /DNA_ID=CAMNT_0016436623 /DNA_START=33 /DNA_END=1148 /DNA_ORIENTATION=+